MKIYSLAAAPASSPSTLPFPGWLLPQGLLAVPGTNELRSGPSPNPTLLPVNLQATCRAQPQVPSLGTYHLELEVKSVSDNGELCEVPRSRSTVIYDG